MKIFYGWLLGVFGTLISSVFLYWYNRMQKIEDFKNGLQAELLEILPRLVASAFQIKQKMGNIDHEFLEWINCISSKITIRFLPEQDIWLKAMLSYKHEDLLSAMAIHKQKMAKTGLSLKKYDLPYIDHNINTLPLLDSRYQNAIIEIQSRLHITNQEIDKYILYFDKTFDPMVYEHNKTIIDSNMDGSLNMISDGLVRLTNTAVNILLTLQSDKSINAKQRLINIIGKAVSMWRKCRQ